MITEEYKKEKTCLFYASTYHLEMILLPYIIKKEKVIIFTEQELETTINTLLEKINLNIEEKQKIKQINWKTEEENKIEEIKSFKEKQENITVIINGKKEYIEHINNKIKEIGNNNIEIIDCYKIGDIDIEETRKKYKIILNTQKLETITR